MNAEFNWWLLIVGLVVGAGLVWLVIADWSRREQDLEADERAVEAAWISDAMHDRGEPVSPDEAEDILAIHREYLRQTGVLDDLAAPPEEDWTADDPTWIPGEGHPEPDADAPDAPAAEAAGMTAATDAAEPHDAPDVPDATRSSVRHTAHSPRAASSTDGGKPPAS